MKKESRRERKKDGQRLIQSEEKKRELEETEVERRVYINIYIYREREREGGDERGKREREK